MQDWTRVVKVGEQGSVDFNLRNAYPVTQVKALFDTLVLGSIDGTDLRNVGSLNFSVPRTPGLFNLTLFVMDSTGCTEITTSARPVQIQ